MKTLRLIISGILIGLSSGAFAVPALQVYGVGSTAVDLTGDEDSWLLTDPTGSLELIGTYQNKNVVSITNAFLVLTTEAVSGNPFGSDYAKFDSADDFERSIGATFNNHSPYGLDAALVDTFVYDLSLIGMDSFARVGETKDCNADVPGTTDCASASNSTGQIHTFNYDFSGLGLDSVHFDLVALITDGGGNRGWRSSWNINPGSHDTTWVKVPESSSVLMLFVGLLSLVAVRRKN